jgi:hypothetical protein
MKDRVTIYMLIYVDDIIIVGSLDSAISQLIKQLEHDFVVKDLDCLEYFLGIEVKKQRSGLLMSQKIYALDLLKRAKMDRCKAISTPMSSTEKLYRGHNTLLKDEE